MLHQKRKSKSFTTNGWAWYIHLHIKLIKLKCFIEIFDLPTIATGMVHKRMDQYEMNGFYVMCTVYLYLSIQIANITQYILYSLG